ncbi:MAG TPA: hypothetical protein VGI39_07635 [Polyangiaceae bacterium]|jgi:hypothetical protein
MACTTFPLAPAATPAPRSLRLWVTLGVASVFTFAYGAFVTLEAARAVREGGLALHIVGFGLAVLACVGGWGALSRHAWGLSLALVAARGNLFLLSSAILLAVWDEWAGMNSPGGDPLVGLAALGAFQAAALLLALHTGREGERLVRHGSGRTRTSFAATDR